MYRPAEWPQASGLSEGGGDHGTTYFIVVDGNPAERGKFKLRVTLL